MIKKRFLLIFYIVFMFLCSLNILVLEASEKTIRIPDYNMGGFIYTDDIGLRAGYSYELFQEIAKYTNWNYTYVKCDRSQCMEMLKNGELDIIDSCIYTEERAKEINYSDMNAGYGNKILVTKRNNDRYISNDFENYDGMKIGIVNEAFWKEALDKIASQKGFKPQVITFTSYAENYEALDNGNVDAILTMGIQDSDDYNVLFEFDSAPYYFAVAKGNEALLNELNQAMGKVWDNDNTYFLKAYNKYFKDKKSDELFLTEEEKEYVKEKGTIKAAIADNRPPMTVFDEESGKYTGIVVDIINLAASKAGIKIEFEKSENYKDAIQKIRRSESNIICDFFYNYSWAEKNGIKMTSPYLDSLEYSEVINKEKVRYDKKALKVAYVDNYFFNEKFLFSKFNRDQMKLYKSEEECIEAVNNGDADAAYIISYVADKIVKEKNYYDIELFKYPEFRHAICIGIGKNEDVRLLTILDKAIESISSDEINNIIGKYSVSGKNDFNMILYIEKYPVIFTTIVLIIIFVGVKVTLRIFKIKKRYDKTIFDLAYIDKVTGLWNINGFISEMIKKINDNDFKDKKFAVISFDISKFRVINEHYGRFVGDKILRYVANNLNNELPYGGVIARSSMDNFLIMLPYYEKKEYFSFLKRVYEKMRYYEDGGIALKLSFQCGIYLITDKSVSVDAAVDMAEIARKEAKTTRNDKIVIFDKKMENKIIKEKEIEENMEKALDEREFIVYYQPKVDIKTEKIIGAEALVRWISKKNGFMNPGEFIPIFEREGFIIELDFFILEEVFKLIKEWLDNGKDPITISVNQSRVHLSNPFYIERLENLIKKYEIPTKYVELELTESLFMEIDTAIDTVNKLKGLGFSISIDDFGSGFSSLNMLKSIPIDVVKIDREFLNESENSQKAQKIICKIVEMAIELDMNVICEGVEKVEQAKFLKSIGCYYAQGFLYAKPMPETEFRDKVKGVIEKIK